MTPKLTLTERIDAYEKLMRLDKPIGILLLLWPALWGLWFASPIVQRMDIVLIFVVGTVLMRSAGCVMNDFADRDIDGIPDDFEAQVGGLSVVDDRDWVLPGYSRTLMELYRDYLK